MPRFRKRSDIVEAIHFTGDNLAEVLAMMDASNAIGVTAEVGKWIVKLSDGKVLALEPGRFAKTYEAV